jgi:hypothetical protein
MKLNEAMHRMEDITLRLVTLSSVEDATRLRGDAETLYIEVTQSDLDAASKKVITDAISEDGIRRHVLAKFGEEGWAKTSFRQRG